MTLRRIILVLAALTLALGASAQSLPKYGEMGSSKGKSANAGSERAKMIGTTIDFNSIPIEYGRYTDDKMEDIENRMKEKMWGAEPTAWERACVLNTKEAYTRYTAMYPYGQHVAEAHKILVDLEVNEAMKKAHSSLPGIKQTLEDNDSPTSTIFVQNNTDYNLTVYYSGTDSKSVTIAPGHRASVTIKNGSYKIAASVPVTTIKPFAGGESFTGGRYEVGFYVAHTAQ